MDVRKLHLAAAAAIAAIAAIAPAVSNANPENAALNACARAFTSSIAAPGSAVRPYRLVYLGDHPQSALSSYYGHEYTFFLKARDPKSGATLARATCTTDMRGTTVALRTEPVDASNPTLAAEF